MLEVAPVPLIRALGEQLGAVYADFHREQGVDVRTNTGIAEFRGSRRLEAAITSTGDVIPCDVAVIGVGVAPATGFLEGSGLDLQNGILTDEFLLHQRPRCLCRRRRRKLVAPHLAGAATAGALRQRHQPGRRRREEHARQGKTLRTSTRWSINTT